MRTRLGVILAAGVALASAGAAGGGVVAPLTAVASTSSWTSNTSTGPSAQAGAAMAWDAATGTDVLFDTSGQTWTWNGSAWANVTPTSASPAARVDAAMAYDANHGQVVLFGGRSADNTTYFADTWTWNGSAWTQRTSTTAPLARAGAPMAWDAGGGGRVLLFGGFDSPATFYADTWAWTGTDWQELIANFVTVAAGPSPRSGAMMAEDAANGTVVLFGGASPQGALNDTWVWYDAGPGRWFSQSPTQSPPARSSGAMGYASVAAAQAPILFGGVSAGGSLLSDTWGWDGRGWSKLTPTGSPAARQRTAMAAGPGGGAVMFGGQGASGALGDTETWTGTVDAAPLAAPTIVTCPSVATPALPTKTGTGTLRGAAAQSHPGLDIGAALPATQIVDTDVEEQITAGSQFSTIASSNQMYWSAMESEQGVFNFCNGDKFVAYAQAYHQQLRLHNLIAGQDAINQSPNWVLNPETPWTATSLGAVMKQWITLAIDHFRGKVGIWDVVNEALDGPNGTPTDDVFARTIGYPKYVEQSFQWAAAANPGGTLLYDDVVSGPGPRMTALENLITDLHNTGSPIDAVGFELNGADLYGIQNVDLASMLATFAAAPYSVKTAITQLTIPLPSVQPPTSTMFQDQATSFAHVMSACLAPASNCFMFMLWGVSDTFGVPTTVTKTLLLSKDTRYGGTLFDEAYQPRPAFGTVLGLLQ